MEGETPFCQILYIRHGERADLAPDTPMEYDVKSDPPLTPLGVGQVQELSEYLKGYIAKHRFEEVILECSGFIRTVQTASIIARALGQKSVKVQYKYAEWMHPAFYDENPIAISLNF